jgi:ribosomal protein S8
MFHLNATKPKLQIVFLQYARSNKKVRHIKILHEKFINLAHRVIYLQVLFMPKLSHFTYVSTGTDTMVIALCLLREDNFKYWNSILGLNYSHRKKPNGLASRKVSIAIRFKIKIKLKYSHKKNNYIHCRYEIRQPNAERQKSSPSNLRWVRRTKRFSFIILTTLAYILLRDFSRKSKECIAKLQIGQRTILFFIFVDKR